MAHKRHESQEPRRRSDSCNNTNACFYSLHFTWNNGTLFQVKCAQREIFPNVSVLKEEPSDEAAERRTPQQPH